MNFIWEKIQITDGEPSERILIIARNLRYAQEWCRIHEINPDSPRIKYITSSNRLHGYADVYYVDLGTDDQDLRSIFDQMKNAGFIKPLLEPSERDYQDIWTTFDVNVESPQTRYINWSAEDEIVDIREIDIERWLKVNVRRFLHDSGNNDLISGTGPEASPDGSSE